jgi:outer membrane protein assembly factor BamB
LCSWFNYRNVIYKIGIETLKHDRETPPSTVSRLVNSVAQELLYVRKPGFFLAISIACAFMSAAEWPTDGGSSKRDAWQRDEKILTTENVKDMKLLWKLKLNNEPREMHSLFPPLIINGVNTANGVKQVVIEAGSSDNLYGVDVATGTLLWSKHLPYKSDKPQLPGRGPLCPGGLTATPMVGPASGSTSRTVYAASSDGMLHQLNPADGDETAPPLKFLPPNAKAYALNWHDNVIYSTTAQGCGGNENGVWAIDLSSAEKKVTNFIPGGRGGLWGRTGAAIGSDGTVYAPTGDGPFNPEKHEFSEAIIAVTPKELKLKDYFSPINAAFMWKRDLDMQVTPVVFDYKGRELLASSSKECRMFLMDSQSLGGADHRTPLYRSPLVCNEEVNFAAAGVWGSLASWQDAKGTRWVLAPFWGPVHPQFKVPVSYGPVQNGAIVAFKVEEKDGKTWLEPAWMSRDMNQAEPPVIANGIVFAYGSGENNTQATPEEGLAANTSKERIRKSTHAILYALDAETGKELWSSGNDITSFAHFSGLSIANGRVYIGTYDSNLYSFGLPGK